MKLWQTLMDNWSKLTFRERHPEITPLIRSFRAFEEMTELLQSEGGTIEDAQTILRQVFGKPKGEPHQELGGVMTCITAYAATKGLDIEEEFFREYMRICDPVVMEKVRLRNLEGDKIGFVKAEPGSEDLRNLVMAGTYMRTGAVYKFTADRIWVHGQAGIVTLEVDPVKFTKYADHLNIYDTVTVTFQSNGDPNRLRLTLNSLERIHEYKS